MFIISICRYFCDQYRIEKPGLGTLPRHRRSSEHAQRTFPAECNWSWLQLLQKYHLVTRMCSCPRAARAWSHERRCHHSATNIIIFGDTGKCVHFRLRASVSKWSWCNDQQNGHNCFSQQQRTSPELQQKSFSVILIQRLQNTSSGFCSGSFTIHLFLYIFAEFVHMRLVLQIQVEWMHFVQNCRHWSPVGMYECGL